MDCRCPNAYPLGLRSGQGEAASPLQPGAASLSLGDELDPHSLGRLREDSSPPAARNLSVPSVLPAKDPHTTETRLLPHASAPEEAAKSYSESCSSPLYLPVTAKPFAQGFVAAGERESLPFRRIEDYGIPQAPLHRVTRGYRRGRRRTPVLGT